MIKNRKPENLTSEEFAYLMNNDPDFRKEMIQRQQAAIDKVETQKKESKERREKKAKEINAFSQSTCGDEDSIACGIVCSAQFIKSAPPSVLRQAVREHRMSAARYRIEMKRRTRRSYYDNIPDKTYDVLRGF